MKKKLFLLCMVAFGFTASLIALVPSTLNYQGRIAVSGVNFTGTGLFKFALINSAGNQTYWSNNGSSSAGSQPTAAVSISVNSGLYSVLLGDTSLTNMTAVPATVFSNADVKLRVWFSDGTNGFQQMTPDQKIASVGYAMVAETVPDGSITAAKLASGVGGGTIADGSITAAKLASGAAAGNLSAGNLSAIAAGGVIGSTDANNAALLAQGFVRDPTAVEWGESWSQMPSGDAVAGHTAIWTGTELLIWGGVVPNASSAAMPTSSYTAINRGIRYNPTTGAWAALPTAGAPQGRFGHSAVWTGTEMIIWGGQSSESSGNPATVLATGGRYNPTTNTWSGILPNATPGPMPDMPGTPDARRGHLAFWANGEMLIWGGSYSTQTFGSTTSGSMVPLPGRRYNLASNTWSNMAATPATLSTPMAYTGVWTGSEMIVWSAQFQGTSDAPRAGRYSPAADAWQTLPRIPGDPVVAEEGYSSVWTGTELILWGGTAAASTVFSNAGYRFNPAGAAGAGSWTTVTTTSAPAGRTKHYAIWSGTEMIIWGGKSFSAGPPPTTVNYNDGGRYNPTTNTWQALSTTDAPPSRTEATFTAAGSKMVLWAGIQNGSMPGMTVKFLKHGGIYQPSTNTWTALSNGSPAPRFGHTAIWTGTDLIVWGGTVNNMSAPDGMDPTFNDGARFNAATGLWTPLPSLNAPSGRFGHTAVWTGTEMIIWGGQRFDSSGGPVPIVMLSTGARYNPLTNLWTPTTNAFPPSARTGHSAVWAGSPVNQMIVWGGSTDGSMMNVNTGGRYVPSSDSWVNITTTGAPMASSGHLSLWTGNEMLVFGGSLMTGYRYYPLSNAWVAMATAPAGLSASISSVWSGTDFLAFESLSPEATLGSYSPVADYWQTLSVIGAPVGTINQPSSIWTGSEMIVWGVTSGVPPTTSITGARYAPATGVWTSLETVGAPTSDTGTATWAGTEMLLWGGTKGSGPTNGTISDKGYRYRLPQSYYLYRRP